MTPSTDPYVELANIIKRSLRAVEPKEQRLNSITMRMTGEDMARFVELALVMAPPTPTHPHPTREQ